MAHENIDVVLGVKPAGEPTEQERAEMHEACANFNLKDHLASLAPPAPVNTSGFVYHQLEAKPGESFGHPILKADLVPKEEKHAEG